MNINSNELFTSKYYKIINEKDLIKFNYNNIIINNNYDIIDINNLLNKYDNIIINRWSIIDNNIINIKNWVPYNKQSIKYIKDDFINSFKKVINNITFNNYILENVNLYSKLISKQKTLGIHIRGNDDDKESFFRSNNNNNNDDILKLEKKCNFFLQNNKNSKIFLISPQEYIINYMKEKFNNNIIVINKKKDYVNNRSNLDGLQDSLVELLVYSKCDELIGTCGSSYSFLAWLYSDCKEINMLF